MKTSGVWYRRRGGTHGRGESAAVLLFCCVLLSACPVRLPVEPIAREPWMARRAALMALQDWTLVGRIGVTTDYEGWHASLNWTQQQQDYVIDLIGPLGQGRMRIWGDEQGVRVQRPDGQVLSAADPEQLLDQTMGLRIPVNGLRYWVRGLPDPARHSVLRGDEQGRLTRLEQGGWVIEYPRYQQVGELDLPTQIRAYQAELNVRLVINQWTL